MSRGTTDARSTRSHRNSLINVGSSQLTKVRKNANRDSPAGTSVICNFRGGLELDESELPNKLIVVIQTNTVSAMEFLLITGCLPGLIAVVGNLVGSVDELHFERQEDLSVMMTKVRRFCSKVIKDPPVRVIQVGLEDEADRLEIEKYLLQKQNSSSESPSGSGNSDSPSASNNEGRNVENLVVIDGQMGSKAKEDHLIINGEKIITSPLQHVSMDIEGDTSTLIKAYCNLPLSYEEYSWVEEYAPSFLPDLSKMTEGERMVHKIQMLQLQLQRIQGIEERQALGAVLGPQDLNTMAQRVLIADELASLKFNLTVEEVAKIKSLGTEVERKLSGGVLGEGKAVEDIQEGDDEKEGGEEDEDEDDIEDGELVLQYDEGAISDEEKEEGAANMTDEVEAKVKT
ncbi:hypothetical protein TrLO_g3282 [Triparma laevis f. longispina]|uniref:Uncharacterized protein n=1 Tax=Triparma laevis f. longispina TaxID=1714387 RepID=A0A9W7FRP8_9STRA|nr:hypothetical protein TrLO_g3282 [Triparma laevis f. longispina]